MLSWITGPRITNVADNLAEPSFIEPPETPAPIFAYRALKHAVFGTPAPPPASPPKVKSQSTVVAVKTTQPASPTKSPTKPQGILMTPGTAAARRKQVTFGSQVVDNEGKKSSRTSRSGIPDDCPGKFPSPFAPKTDVVPEAKSRTRLTAALYKAKDHKDGDPQKELEPEPEPEPEKAHVGHVAVDSAPVLPRPHPDSKRRPRRLSRINSVEQEIPVLEPTTNVPSERPSSSSATSSSSYQSCDTNPSPEVPYEPDSAAYWKSIHENYAAKSERETKRLVKKASIAKDYAKQKDEECTELRTKLSAERKRHKSREKELMSQTKEYQERLRDALAENAGISVEIANLKKKLADVEVTATAGFDAEAVTSGSPRKTERLRITREGGSRVISPRKRPSPQKRRGSSAALSGLWEEQAEELPKTEVRPRKLSFSAQASKETHDVKGQVPKTEAIEPEVPPSTQAIKENYVFDEEQGKIIITDLTTAKPKAEHTSMKTKLKNLSGDRISSAAERIAARKAQRQAEKENKKPLR